MRNQKFINVHITNAKRIHLGGIQLGPLAAITLALHGTKAGHAIRSSFEDGELYITPRPWMAEALLDIARVTFNPEAVSLAEDIARA